MYYVNNNSAGVPALFRDTPVGVAATPTPEELVEGVGKRCNLPTVSTRARHLMDRRTSSIRTATGDPYLTASQINDPASVVPGANAEQRWSRVVSVRISLLMRTVDDRVVSTPQQYTFKGVLTTATDLRMRKVFTHVIKVRNR